MIEERVVDVAVCDACGHREYSDSYGNFADSKGYTLTIAHHDSGTQHQAVACRDNHIGKAARAVLDRWRLEENPPLRDDTAPVPDAPPLPARPDQEAGQ